MKGMKQLQDRLKDLEKSAKELEQTNYVSFEELFTDSFMTQNTSFSSMDEMVDKSPFTISSPEDFAEIPDLEWDQYVKSNTNFSNWHEMLDQAGQEYAIKKLGF